MACIVHVQLPTGLVLVALLWLENKAWATNCSHAKIAATPEIKFGRNSQWELCPEMLILTCWMCCAVTLLVHCLPPIPSPAVMVFGVMTSLCMATYVKSRET